MTKWFHHKPFLIFVTILLSGFMFRHEIVAQEIVANKRIVLNNSSTLIKNIFVDGDSLLMVGEVGRDSTGLQGVFILKTDTIGNLGPVKFFKDPKQLDQMILSGSHPVIVNSENIILAGDYLWKSDNYIINYQRNADTFLYKEYSSSFLVRLTESIISLDKAIYLIGFVQTQNFDLDVFVLKIDSVGNKLWEKTYGSPSKDETGRDVIIEDGGLTVMISESYDPTPTIKNDTRYWIRFMHIDTSGTILRDWKEEVTGFEGWSGSCLKYRDDYIYTSNTIGEETNSGPITGGQVVRRDGNFNLVWRKKYGEPDSQYSGFGDLIFSGDSCLYATGQNVDSGRPYNSARILKIGLDGHTFWEVRDTGISLPNGQSLNFMEGITMKSCNSIFAVGYTYKKAGLYEGLVFKVTGDGCMDTLCTTTDIENLIRAEKQHMLIYPNPASSSIKIYFADNLKRLAKFGLYDYMGILRKSFSITDSISDLDISTLPNGVYWLIAESSGKLLATQKLIKIGQ